MARKLLFPPKYIDAVQALVGGTTGVGGKSDGPREKIYYPADFTLPSEDVIQAKLTELTAEFEADDYVRNRELEYPTIEELTVALYDTDDKTALETKRAAVKTKWAKDNSGPV